MCEIVAECVSGVAEGGGRWCVEDMNREGVGSECVEERKRRTGG